MPDLSTLSGDELDSVFSGPAPADLRGVPSDDLDQILSGKPLDQLRAERLDAARAKTPGHEDAFTYIQRRSAPFMSAAVNVDMAQKYKGAVERFQAGNADTKDYDTIARFEKLQEIDRQRGTGSAIASGLARIPAILGEAYVAGPLTKGITAPLGMGGAIPSLVAGTARTAATTALMPSMYAEHAAQRALEQGGEWYEPKNLGPAMGLGAIQVAILGRLGKPIGFVPTVAGRLLTRTAAGMAEQQGADALTSVIDNVLPEAYEFKTKYGLMGSVLRGDEGAAKQAAVQALTFAVFSALHAGGEKDAQKEAARQELENYNAKLLSMSKRLKSPEEAAQAILADQKGLQETLVNLAKKGPPATPEPQQPDVQATQGPRQATIAPEPTQTPTSQEIVGPGAVSPQLAQPPTPPPTIEAPPQKVVQDYIDRGPSLEQRLAGVSARSVGGGKYATFFADGSAILDGPSQLKLFRSEAAALEAGREAMRQENALAEREARRQRPITQVSRQELLARVDKGEGGLEAVRARFEAGEMSAREVFDAVGLTEQERAILTSGATQPLRTQGAQVGLSGERVRKIKADVMAKLGRPDESFDKVVRPVLQADAALERAEAGKLGGALEPSAAQEALKRLPKRLDEIDLAQRDADKLKKTYIREKLSGKLTPEREAEIVAEFTRLDRIASGQTQAKAAAPGAIPEAPPVAPPVQPEGQPGAGPPVAPEATPRTAEGDTAPGAAAARGGEANRDQLRRNLFAMQRSSAPPTPPVPPSGPTPAPAAPTPPPSRKGVIDALKSWLAPASRGPEAKVGAGVLRENLAELARKKEIAQQALRSASAFFDTHVVGAPDPEVRKTRFLEVMDAIEGGRIDTLSEPMKGFAETIRGLTDERSAQLAERDLVKSFIENYMGHLWKKQGSDLAPEEIGRVLAGRRPLAGSEGFRQKRSIPTYRDGIEAGLEPADWNPARLALMTLHEMDRSVMGHDVVAELKDNAMWKFVRLGGKVPEGWTRIEDKLARVFSPGEVKLTEYFDKQQMAALEDFAGSIGVDVKTMTRMHGEGQETQGEILRKFGTPEEILAHEIGHAIERRHDFSDMLTDPEMSRELTALADLRSSGRPSPEYQAYIRGDQERIANLFAAYIHAPELLKETAPKSFAALDSYLASDPDLAGLRDIKPSLQLGEREQVMRLGGPILRGTYYTPEPVAKLLNNYLTPGLWGNPLYNMARVTGNVLNQMQLGFSAFHAGFVVMDTQMSAVALGLQQISRGELKGFKTLGLGAIPGVAPFRAFLQGSKMLKEYYAPGSQGAETAALVDSLTEAGGRARMDAFYGGTHLDSFRSAVREAISNRSPKAAGNAMLNAFPALTEVLSKPVMEMLVPRMKLGVFADMARAELERLGPSADLNARRDALSKSWDSVENRLGQLTYDNLFWNRTFKDILMAGVRSVGWNIGTIRELGGGAKDVLKAPVGIYRGEGVSPRLAYLVALPMVTALYGAMYQYLATGKGPDEAKDFFFPKTGRTRKDGSADRVSLPTYMRDVAALGNRGDEGPLRWSQNAATMTTHKLNPLVTTVWEMLTNQDFYGTALRNPNDTWVKQAKDTALHLIGALEPFASRNVRTQKTGGNTADYAQSFFGITPAPSYVVHSAEEQRQAEAGRRIELSPQEKLKKETQAGPPPKPRSGGRSRRQRLEQAALRILGQTPVDGGEL